MFVYEKKLQYPVKIATPNPKLAAASSVSTEALTASWVPPCAISASATPCPTRS